MTPTGARPVAVQTWVVHLSRDECLDLLAASTLGRLGVIVKGRPEIFPINHVYDAGSGTVVFPTRRGTKLEAALDWPTVAFEIDGVSPDGESGWSVLVVGHAEEVTDPDQTAAVAAARTARWAAGTSTRWLRIVPSSITGRRISAADP
jgi:nitroimidazol reductase NimA-like FMN-containing flavoprotein (pyridoxamine 5'-phosphate oxidase superfamily)